MHFAKTVRAWTPVDARPSFSHVLHRIEADSGRPGKVRCLEILEARLKRHQVQANFLLHHMI